MAPVLDTIHTLAPHAQVHINALAAMASDASKALHAAAGEAKNVKYMGEYSSYCSKTFSF